MEKEQCVEQGICVVQFQDKGKLLRMMKVLAIQ
jgi:hypothetical protein